MQGGCGGSSRKEMELVGVLLGSWGDNLQGFLLWMPKLLAVSSGASGCDAWVPNNLFCS